MKRSGVFLGAALSLGVLLAGNGKLVGQEPAEEKAIFVGSQVCAGCHQELAKEWESLSHTQYLTAAKREAPGKGCEECHGPGSKHIAGDLTAISNPAKLKPEEANKRCLQCHRGTLKAQEWHASAHGGARLACTSCHEMHHETKAAISLRAPATDLCLSCHPAQRSQFKQNSHHPVLEGRLSCLDCHNPHSGGDEPSRVQAGHEQLCVTCHTDKAGPFTYEHDPATGDTAEGCLTCHRGHGSPNPQLQRLSGRGLCQQCHFDQVTHNPGQTCWTVGCHSEIHGSHRSPQLLR